ncbi:hypothetical protein DRO42_08725, partial [Candidatus Bathyarchaeota archaeon]
MAARNPQGPTVAIVRTDTLEYERIDIRKMVREAIEMLGGIDVFVGHDTRVFIKPNVVTNVPATAGVTVEPRIVGALVELAREAGARQVWVGDSTVNWSKAHDVMADLGLIEEVERYGGRIVDLDAVPVARLDIPNGHAVRCMEVPQPLLEADAIIDVAKAKTHMIDGISCCIKNWVGIIPQKTRLQYHQMPRLSQVVVDLMSRLPPALCVVDALGIGAGEGPLAVESRSMGLVIAGDDPVATDVVVGQLRGLGADERLFAYTAYFAGLGEIDMSKVEVRGPTLDDLRVRVRRPIPGLCNRFPCNVALGGACWGGLTWLVGTFVTWQRDGTWDRIGEALGKPTFMIGFNAEDPAFE